MSPREIRACYRLYAADRKSHEICALPEAILTNDDGALAERAALRLHTGLEGPAREIGDCDPAPMLVAIRSIDGERVPKVMKWGLIPHWAKDRRH